MKIAILAALFSVGLISAATISISGTVVDDATGAPISRPEVRIVDSRHPALPVDALSRDDGSFQADLPPGEYTVTAWHAGYLFSEITASENPLAVRLVRLGAIEGQLTGLQGRTATVLALYRTVDKKTEKETWKPAVDDITRGIPVDGSGNFRIPDLPPGAYALLVAYSSEGLLRYPEGKSVYELQPGGATLRVQIPIPSNPVRTITGQVELPDPADWYWVTLSRPDQPALAVATTVTDEKGGFAFRGVAPAAYELLAVPGIGERATHSASELPYHGFARTSADATKEDARDVKVTPRPSIRVSVALSEEVKIAKFTDRNCRNATVMLAPLEDWGIKLERRGTLVKIGNDPSDSSPQPIDGLAPARYGVNLEISGDDCSVADNPVLDLTQTAAGNIEGKIREPGTLRGTADAGVEVTLIPDDFSSGWSYLPYYWFSDHPFGAGLHFRQSRWDLVSHIRQALADDKGHFEFSRVGAGTYRVGIHGQEMKPIEVRPAAITGIELTEIELTSPK